MGLQLEGVKVKPKDLRPNLPEQAQAVILKALAKKPDERFATARDFGEAFVKGLAANSHSRTVTMTETHQPRQQPAKRDKRWVWASVLVLAIAAVAWILWPNNNVSERGTYQVVEKSVSAPTRVVPETKLSPPRPDEHSKQTASRITKGASVKGATKVEVQPGLPAKPVAGAVKVNVKDGQRYRWIPAGFFQMGCSNGDIECFNNEKPVRIVTITKGFWIGETEVTQAAYEKVTGQNRSVSKSAKLPVENVSWHEAQSYCQAAGMRLPTEAEWEYAARAGSDQSRYGELGAVAWYGGNSEGRTHEVGQKAANVWGLYDTLGNVWEWMADWYVEVHPANSEADPGGPSSGEYRSTRGGNFRADARSVRVSVRRRDVPGRRSPFTGFRCVESELMPRTIVAPVAMSTPKTQVNPRDGLTYAWIPAGTFWMGCSPGDTQCAPNESPRRQVTITKGFWMGQTEVTREAYQRVLGRARGDSSEYRLPVGNVTWDQAQGYCSVVGMRLPTEAEWEYAARAGSTAPRYGDLNEVAWWSGDSGGKAHEVAGKQPNANGLYDMLGNHREWVADWFDAEYYGTAPGSDPPGPGSGQARVQRGGAWPGTEDRLRASTRIWSPPRALERTNGFRCAGSAMGTTP
jgi:formylglycine-generating enzyme required for sulfatase activity